MDDWVVNGAYTVSLAALAVRDVLWLRMLLLVAQLLFLWWGLLIDNTPTLLWNSAFLALNAAMIGRLLWERRPVEVPAAWRDIHEQVFAGTSARDFLMLWELGNPHRRTDARLVAEGEHPDALQLVVNGRARVERNGTAVAHIDRGGFVAEMSLLTGEPASADVVADGTVEVVSWSRRKLATLERAQPHLYLVLQKALGRDLSSKVRKG